ncbi:MAG: glycoside hydrolase family protein [Paludibacteraceae bacterium]|nr:glycoside hydrolase family protein [Paludibacteraceae bacterium]
MIALAFVLAIAACTPIENPDSKPDPKPDQLLDETNVVDVMPKSAKRGVSFSFTNVMDLPLLSPYISWDYNWGNTPTDNAATWFDSNEMDFCPMCWNGSYSPDRIRSYVAAHPNTKYLLAFNEPNLTDQANMTPAQAAAIWPPVVALAKELNLKLVSPAMNYGTLSGYSNPIKWLDEFFAQPNVSIGDVDAIAIHCYMSSASSVQGYVEMFEKYNKPIWLTEFCAWDPAPSGYPTQMDYMCAVLHYLESRESVQRYAWFMPRMSGKVESVPYNQLLTHDYPPALTDLGKMFCYLSPMDKTVWLRATRPILASEYVSLTNNAMALRPSSDQEILTQLGRDGLMISNFAAGQTLDYQVFVPLNCTKITLRYCGYSNSICEVLVDGESQNFADMARNGSNTEWIAVDVPVNMKAGKHTVTLSLVSGSCLLSSLIIQ